MMKIILYLLLIFFVSGCTVLSPDIPASSHDRTDYAGWDCVRLGDRNRSLDDLIKLAGATWETFMVVTAGGPLLVSATKYPLYAEISRLKGEQVAVKDALSKCSHSGAPKSAN
jgi:hypothetical protein